MRIVVGISGSSGAIYGVRTVEVLSQASDIEVHLVMSDSAKRTIAYETAYDPEEVERWAHTVYDVRDIGAAISSGSFKTAGMIIAPCSIKTMSGVANSYNDNLLTRAADVCLKERRKLVLMVRETPFHYGHLRMMMDLTMAGGVILPPVPSFYHRPRVLDDIVNQSVQKALDQFNIEANLFARWKGTEEKEKAEA